MRRGFVWRRRHFHSRFERRSNGAGLDVRGLERRRRRILRGEHVPALLFHLLDLFDHGGDDVVELFALFEKVADVQEGVAVEADFHEGRLHAWQHAGHTAFVNASD